MPKQKIDGGDRRTSLLKSLDSSVGGRARTHFVKWLADLDSSCRLEECTISGYCRTSIFEYPVSWLIEPIDHQTIYFHGGFKAGIVSDLPAYFDSHPSESPHNSIDVSLRDGVRRTYEQALEQARRQTQPNLPLFLIVEEHREFDPTILNSGECFTIDECRDGVALIEGGRKGERAIVAVKTSDGSWPDFNADAHAVNTVLAAVKMEQNITGHIEELYSCSCFVSSEGQAVYTLAPTLGPAGAHVVSRLESRDVREKADRLKSMLQAMMSDAEPTVPELFDSLVLDNTEDDSYLRLWYLRLWQAVEDAKKFLGYPQLSNINTVVAGKISPKELKEYRNEIAHWRTGRIDFQNLNNLQLTAMELLRRKYQPTIPSRSDPSEE